MRNPETSFVRHQIQEKISHRFGRNLPNGVCITNTMLNGEFDTFWIYRKNLQYPSGMHSFLIAKKAVRWSIARQGMARTEVVA
jgi:hypothetical protein